MRKILLISLTMWVLVIPFYAQTLSDFDNNTYNIITIGNQVWMKENLRSVHYSDGSVISGVWSYNGSDSLVANYGRLYSWNSAMRNAASSNSVPSGVQGVCPAGWHLPSAAEWNTLIDLYGGQMSAGAGLKESGTVHWNSPNTGATNSSGFTALAAGSRNEPGGDFNLMGSTGFYWTTENLNDYVQEILMGSESEGAIQLGSYMYPGYNFEDISVRCLKNSGGASVETEIEKELISINPYFSGNRIAIFHETIPQIQIVVVSVEGKTLIQSTLSATETLIDIGSLPSGLYILRARGMGISVIKKFIKN